MLRRISEMLSHNHPFVSSVVFGAPSNSTMFRSIQSNTYPIPRRANTYPLRNLRFVANHAYPTEI